METAPKTAGHRKFLELQAQRVASLNKALCEHLPEPAEVVLEIGCGHGHFLTAFAEQHREANCIGLDLVSRRIRKANAKRDKRGLQHLTFIKADIREFLMAWPDHLRFERIFILFPDPWPKKRHTKNRILQPGLLDALAENARTGTSLHFRTDDESNYAWGMEVIAAHAEWEICDDADWPFENPSFFQDLFTEYSSLTALFAG